MEISENAQIIIEKLKRDYKIKGIAGVVLLDSIGSSLTEIEEAEKQLKEDSGQKGITLVHYGFILDRFGDKKRHPATTIIKDAKSNIVQCLKAMGVEVELGNGKDLPKGGLRGVMNKAG